MVLVCSGASAAGLYIKTGGTAGEQFGYDVAAVGDVDHDGIVDFVAGARYAKVSIHPHAGYATLHSGATGNLLNTVVGSIDNGELGTSVAGVGDINGDGTPDWAVGQPGSDLNGPDSGRVIVITGNGPPYSVLRVLLGANGTRFGTAVAGIGDYDGDGTPDVMVGAPLYDKLGGGDAGQVTVWSGSTSSQLYWRLGEHGSEQLGRTVGTAGDLNGDGKQELVMGSGFSAVGGSYSGVLRVFLANATGPAVYCKTKTNSAGCHPAIYGEGVASFSVGNGFRVGAISVLPGNPGMMFWSRSDAAIPFRGGTLCLGSPLFRTTGQVAGGSPGSPCSGTYLFEFDGAYAASHALAPGDTVYAQYWSRDGGFAPPDNVGLTNALRFTFAP